MKKKIYMKRFILMVLLIGIAISMILIRERLNNDEKKNDPKISSLSNNNTYEIIYNGGNKNVKGQVKSHECNTNKQCQIKNNSFQRDGYVFVGWTTKSNGQDDGFGWTEWGGTWKYINGQYGIKNNQLILYAMWAKKEKNKFIIIYHGNGANAGFTSHQVCTNGELCSIKSSKFVKIGYSFVGWTTNNNGKDDGYNWTNWSGTWRYSDGQYGIDENELHLYARWKRKDKYEIIYYGNGATSGNVLSQICWIGEPCLINNNQDGFIKDNYKFIGWTTNENGKDDGYKWTNWSGTWNYINGQYGIKDDKLVLYARWEKIKNDYYNEPPSSNNSNQNKTIKIEPSRVYLKYGNGNYVDLKAILPSEEQNKKITWTSSNTILVQVDKNGRVTAYNNGEDYINTVLLGDAIITAKTKDGYQGMIRVTVTSIDVSVNKERKQFIINDVESKEGKIGDGSFDIEKEYNDCKKSAKTIKVESEPAKKYNDQNNKIHFIDVGRGDATLIESKGEFGLIDAGYDSQNETDPEYAYYYIGNILNGRKLKFVMLTHWHSDHVGGLYDIISEGYVDKNTKFYFNKPAELTKNNSAYKKLYCDMLVNMRDTIGNDNNMIYVTNKKDDIKIKIGDMEVLILENKFPDGYYSDESKEKKLTDENRNSIGALITYKGKRVLITGDMGEGDEYRIAEKLSKKGISTIDVYKMGHHGATPAAYTPFIDYIEPKNVVISNTYDSVRPHGNENLSAMCYMQYYYDSKLYLTGNARIENYGNLIADNNGKIAKIKGSIVYDFNKNNFYDSDTSNVMKPNQRPVDLCKKGDKNGVKTIRFTNATDEYENKICDLYFEYGTFISGKRNGVNYKEAGTPTKDYYRAPGRVCR